MSDTVKAKIAHFGIENIEPGDILLTNDAYITGSHLNHMTFTVPIFHEGELVGVLLLHGALAGHRRHARRHDDRHLFRRPADADRQDLPQGRAQRGARLDHPDERAPAGARDGRLPRAGRRGEDRRAALPRDARRSTAATPCSAASRRSWITARRWPASACGEIPDGVYEAESFMDDDGVDVGKRVPIKVQRRGQGRPDDGRPHRRRRSRSAASTIPARRRAARAARSRSSA